MPVILSYHNHWCVECRVLGDHPTCDSCLSARVCTTCAVQGLCRKCRPVVVPPLRLQPAAQRASPLLNSSDSVRTTHTITSSSSNSNHTITTTTKSPTVHPRVTKWMKAMRHIIEIKPRVNRILVVILRPPFNHPTYAELVPSRLPKMVMRELRSVRSRTPSHHCAALYAHVMRHEVEEIDIDRPFRRMLTFGPGRACE